MSAIIFKSSETLTDPKPGTPFLPDIDTGLFFDFSASELVGYDEAADVSSFIALGEAPLAYRTMSNKLSAAAEFPKYSPNLGPNETPCLLFNGQARISNLTGSGNALTPTFPQPITDFFVCYLEPVTQGTSRRLIGGQTGNLHNVQLNSSGNVSMNAGTHVDSPFSPHLLPVGLWYAFGVVFDGANTKLIKPNGDIVPATIDPGTNSMAGFTYGHSAGTVSPGSGMIGRIAEHKMFTRAFSDVDLVGMIDFLNDKYGL